MIITEEDYLMHYGVLRKSGRYPWGSGETQSARNRSFLATIEQHQKDGWSEADIAKAYSTDTEKFNTSNLRALKSIAIAQQKQEQIQFAQRLKDKGMSNSAIGRQMEINESTVRGLLAPGAADKANVLQSTADMLRKQVDEKGLVDIGAGVNLDLNISPDRLKVAVAMLQEEGYKKHYINVPQLGTSHDTKHIVLSKPGVTGKEAWAQRDNIQSISAYSPDNGRNYIEPRIPTPVSSKRVAVKYAEDGGTEADGVIYIRPGAKDLSLGKSSYAQVRIAVDDTHYLKGMAIYKDDLPDGVDLQFNTNKSDTGNKLDAMKKQDKTDPLNPFGASIKPGGQRGALNIVNEEGDWDGWSRSLSSQFLSKQKPALAKAQLDTTYTSQRKDLDELKALTNPVVKKKLLESYADGADSAAVHLKAAIIPGTANHVLLPVKSVKETEIFAPNFNNGDRVALVRHPHGGTFEIPELTVNNKNAEAKRLIGVNAKDAVGINSKVAERLSGADFDGDTVLVIPNNRKQVQSSPALDGLKGFDPQMYKIPEGSPIKRMGEKGGGNKQTEMGNISNLIADMTIHGAPHDKLARAVRHSMVVIDAEKHGLDYRASARANGIKDLKREYQEGANRGANTLLTRSTSETSVNQRKLRKAKDGGPIDPATGKLVYVETGKSYVNRKGEITFNKEKVQKGALTDDAFTLVSKDGGTKMEHVYAEHANRMKALANEARKTMVNTRNPLMNKQAKVVYKDEVDSLNAKLRIALRNAPLERQAQVIANGMVRARKDAHPEMDGDTEKKIKNQALTEARLRTGAGKQKIDITPDEWNAIQAGAISTSKLESILNNSDLDVVRKLATPRVRTSMTTAKQLRAKTLLANGATQKEVASALGVPLGTLKSFLSEGGE